MKLKTLFTLLLALLLVATMSTACDDGDGGDDKDTTTTDQTEVEGDVTPDETEDVTPDETEDVTPDETEEDVTPDEVEDVTPDEVEDVTPDEVEDVTPDEVEDVTPDEIEDVTPDEDMGPMPEPDPAAAAQIQAVRDLCDRDATEEPFCSEGSVAISGAAVTYIKESNGSGNDDAGFFLQATQEGPAIFVLGDASTLSVGDIVDVNITEAALSGGIISAAAFDGLTVNESGYDVSLLAQDITTSPMWSPI